MMLIVSVVVGLLALVGAQNLSAPNDGFSESPIVPGHNAFPLRILPLGASITWGQGSSDGNGYREHLRTLLLQRDTVVDMVGTVKSGLMADSENEGHPGARVDQVAEWVDTDVHFRPNLVLINAGTNDALHEDPDFPLDEISARMEDLIKDLFSRIPGVTIVVSTLLPTQNAAGDEKIRNYINPRYEAVVKYGQKEKRRIVLADLHSALTTEDLIDGVHPTDEGYKKVAEAWLPAIYEAGRKKMLVEPSPLSPLTELPPDHAETHRTGKTPVTDSQAMTSQAPKTNFAPNNTLTWLAWLMPCLYLWAYMS